MLDRNAISEALVEVVARYPGLTAREYVKHLKAQRVYTDRRMVNSILYSSPKFESRGAAAPMWYLAGGLPWVHSPANEGEGSTPEEILDLLRPM